MVAVILMMMIEINISLRREFPLMPQFATDIFAQFSQKWALLCAGTKEKHDAMTNKVLSTY